MGDVKSWTCVCDKGHEFPVEAVEYLAHAAEQKRVAALESRLKALEAERAEWRRQGAEAAIDAAMERPKTGQEYEIWRKNRATSIVTDKWPEAEQPVRGTEPDARRYWNQNPRESPLPPVSLTKDQWKEAYKAWLETPGGIKRVNGSPYPTIFEAGWNSAISAYTQSQENKERGTQ